MTFVGKSYVWSEWLSFHEIDYMVGTNLLAFSKVNPNARGSMAKLAEWELSRYILMHISPNFWIEDRIFSFPSQNIVEMGLNL